MTDREWDLINVEEWPEIRRLHRAEGMGVKAIVRKLGVARNTVRAALRSEDAPRLRQPDLVRSATMVVRGTQFVAGYQPLMRGVLELFEEHGRVSAPIDLYVSIMSILPPAARADAGQIASVEALAETFIAGFGPGGQHGQIAANVSSGSNTPRPRLPADG